LISALDEFGVMPGGEIDEYGKNSIADVPPVVRATEHAHGRDNPVQEPCQVDAKPRRPGPSLRQTRDLREIRRQMAWRGVAHFA